MHGMSVAGGGRRWRAAHGGGGDLVDAPDDQALYSADGRQEWLEATKVRGTLVAAYRLRTVLLFVLFMVLLSPAMAFAFFDALN